MGIRRLAVLGLFLVVLVGGCIGPTEVSDASRSGIILKDETWSGTIHVTGDIYVPENVKLTILPGTKVLIRANSDDTNRGGTHIIDETTETDPSSTEGYTRTHTGFNIAGTLTAAGTQEEKIIFTSDAEDPYNTDWDGINFEPTSSGTMEYCIIEWAHTGPALHGTNDVNISHCEIRHTFWGGLHAFENSPVFEYNVLDDIGHEAFDTHKASPVIRFNNISHARTGAVLNYYDLKTGKPVIFENNTIRDSSNLMQLQENAYAIIRNNNFMGSDDTGGPWEYMGYVLDSQPHSNGMNLADNVNVEITGNKFTGMWGPSIIYERIGPNQGIGHTTDVPEPFEIGDSPIRILIRGNHFDKTIEEEELEELAMEWKNIEVAGNTFE